MTSPMHKPKVYMICGFIGAGKTTFSRKLEKETGAIRITKDEWLVRIFGNSPPKDKFKEYDDHVSKLSEDIAFRIVEAGVDVILDDGFWLKKQRDDTRRRIIEVGATPILYYVKQPIDLMRQRTIDRSKNPPPDSFEIEAGAFDAYLQYWQPPGADEEYLLAE